MLLKYTQNSTNKIKRKTKKLNAHFPVIFPRLPKPYLMPQYFWQAHLQLDRKSTSVQPKRKNTIFSSNLKIDLDKRYILSIVTARNGNAKYILTYWSQKIIPRKSRYIFWKLFCGVLDNFVFASKYWLIGLCRRLIHGNREILKAFLRCSW